jgi:hypothetical protein
MFKKCWKLMVEIVNLKKMGAVVFLFEQSLSEKEKPAIEWKPFVHFLHYFKYFFLIFWHVLAFQQVLGIQVGSLSYYLTFVDKGTAKNEYLPWLRIAVDIASASGKEDLGSNPAWVLGKS